jgi:hypothetical protein
MKRGTTPGVIGGANPAAPPGYDLRAANAHPAGLLARLGAALRTWWEMLP